MTRAEISLALGAVLIITTLDRALDGSWGLAAGVPDCHPHRFRHTLGTELLEQTQDLKLVQDALGHRSITSTVIYTRVRHERLRQAFNTLPWGRT